MKQKLYTMRTDGGMAHFKVPLDVLRQELGNHPNWTPRVLEMAEYNKLFTGLASFYGGMHSKLLEQTASSFLVQGVAGKGFVLYYLVRKHDETSVMIEPVARIESSMKAGIYIRLAMMCIFPVVFAPMLIKNKSEQAKKFSQELLPVFCSYLETRFAR